MFLVLLRNSLSLVILLAEVYFHDIIDMMMWLFFCFKHWLLPFYFYVIFLPNFEANNVFHAKFISDTNLYWHHVIGFRNKNLYFIFFTHVDFA